MRRLLESNKEFHKNIVKYNRIDALFAIGLFCIISLLYVIIAVLETKYPAIKESSILIGCGLNILMIIVTILFIKIRKDSFSSIGIYSGKWKLSCLIGLILAAVFFYTNCLSHVIDGADFVEIKDIIKFVVYYLTVALCEEIVFRGYIGTRLYGFIKNQYLVILTSGILFIIMHFPYRMIVYGMTISDLTIFNMGWIIDLFITHIVLTFIYLKTNSLYGSIISHWMSNLAYNLVLR